MPNSYIVKALTSYIENPNPCYALMLKGKWGCGKTYLVNQWIEDTFKNSVKKDDVVLEPIRVTLYGMTDTEQITKAIDRQLHPFLYSKAAKIGFNILKIAGKVVLRTDLDFNSDGKNDATLTTSLDSLSFLASKDETIKPNSLKLLVFDDLERSHIPMKQLLGYINYFVEYCSCHVIIVGDESKITDSNDIKTLNDFKEKTVGREFEVMPDITAAIDYFIYNDLPLTEWLTCWKTFILDCFRFTKCNNLRLLRQCLYDFSVLYNEIDDHLLKEGDSFLTSLLGSYIVVYCEYRGENRDLLKNWDWSYFNGLCGDERTKEKISNLHKKYSSLVNYYKIEVLDTSHVKQIIHEIETGQSVKVYVEKSLNLLQEKESLQDRLAEFVNLSNEEFEQAYNELVGDIKTGKSPNLHILGRSLALLVFFDYKKIHTIAEDTISHAKELIERLFSSIYNKDALYQARNAFYQGISSYGKFYEYPLGMKITDFATAMFEKRNNELKNKMEEALLNIDNDSIERLIELSNESSPDHHCEYRLTAVFKHIDADIFSDRILNLNNRSIRELCQFFYQHYKFYYGLGNGYNCYTEDLPILQHVIKRLESELPKRTGVDGYVLKNLIKYVDGAVRRANGENDPINISDD